MGQAFEPVESFVGPESTVGIQSELHGLLVESLSDAAQKFDFLFEIDGSDLQFHATEALPEFFFKPRCHLAECPHPHQSIDGDSLFAPCKGRIG